MLTIEACGSRHNRSLAASKPIFLPEATSPSVRPTPSIGAPAADDKINSAPIEETAFFSFPVRPPKIAACIIAVEGESIFSNENPDLEGVIVGTGAKEAQKKCFETDNWPNVLPRAPQKGEVSAILETPLWWRFKDTQGTMWVIGMLAPGMKTVDINKNDKIVVHWPISWTAWSWGFGTATVEIPNKLRISFVLNKPGPFGITKTERRLRPGSPCELYEASLRLFVNSTGVDIGPNETVTVGNATISNEQIFPSLDKCLEGNGGYCTPSDCVKPWKTWVVSVVEKTTVRR
jgi:hypothetical protein